MDEEIDIPIDLDLSSVRQAMAGFRSQLLAGQESVNDLVTSQMELTPAIETAREAMSELRSATQFVDIEVEDLTSTATAGLANHKTLVDQAATSWRGLGDAVSGNAGELDDVSRRANRSAAAIRDANRSLTTARKNLPTKFSPVNVPVEVDVSRVNPAMMAFRREVDGARETVADLTSTHSQLPAVVDESRSSMSDLRRATAVMGDEFDEITTHVTSGLASHKQLVHQVSGAWEDLGAVVTGNVRQLDDVVDHANKAATALGNVNQSIRGAGGNVPETIQASIVALDELALSSMAVGGEMKMSATAMGAMLGVSSKIAAMTLPATLTNVSSASAAVSWNMWRAGAITASTWAFIPAKIIGVGQALIGLLKLFAPLISGLRFIAIRAAAAGQSLWIIGQVASTMSAALMAFATIAKTVFMTVKLSVMLALSPFWLMWKAVTAVTGAIWTVLKPVLKLWLAWQGLKIQLNATRLALKWIAKIVGTLSWRMRFLFFAVTALGISARTTALAATALAKALGVLNLGTRLLKATFGALINPVGAAREMLLLLRDAVIFTARVLFRLARAAYTAGAALARLGARSAVAGLRAAGDMASNMIMKMWQLRASVASLAMLFTAGFGLWGMKLAAQAEQAHIPFKNLLGSVAHGQKMLQEIEDFAATTPFQNADIQEGGRSLLTAGVAATSLIDDLRMLGDVASGTQKPLLDYTRIYSQIRTNGRATTEHIKQLADRTVPIWQALMRTMGVDSQDAIRKMASQGEISFADMRKALQLTTSTLNDGIGAAGIFANATQEQSLTLSGLWSTMKDNIGFVARAFGEQISGAINLKGILSGVILQLQVWRSRVHELRPAIIATYELLLQALDSAKIAAKSVAETFGISGNDMIASFVEVATIITWSMREWPLIAQLVFAKLKYYVVEFTNETIHLFTVAIPSALKQLPKLIEQNWELFKAAATNDVNKLKKLMARPMNLKGFRVPKRAIGDLEKQLKKAADVIETKTASSLEKDLTRSFDMIKRVRAEQKKLAEERAAMLAGTTFTDDGQSQDNPEVKKTMSIVVEAADRDSAEAFRAIFQRSSQNQIQKQTLDESKKQTGLLASIRDRIAQPQYETAEAVA